ncbi:MAG: hypothetical protein AABX01_01545 [Candidatus Micrarchaeota archaeon]
MNASEVEELQKEFKATMERLMPDKNYFIGISLEDKNDFKVASVTNLKEDSLYYIARGVIGGFIQIAEQLQLRHLGRG